MAPAAQAAPPRSDTDPNRLVEDHLGLARSLSRRFTGRGEPLEDLEQVAMVALLGAAHRYDPEREVAFTTFATVSILGELKRHFRDRAWWVRPPRRIHDTYLTVAEARDNLAHRYGRSPTIAEIGRYLGIAEEQVLEAVEASGSYRPSSLDAPSGDDGPTPIEELTSSADDSYDQALDRQRLTELLPTLDQDEMAVVKAYFFDDRTQLDIGRELGVSQMQVSRILSRITRRFRSEF